MAARPASLLILLVLAAPALVGLAGTMVLASGQLFDATVALPAFVLWATLLSVWTGFAATLLALAISFAILAAFGGRAARLLSPVAAVPHAALGLALAFLISPSGWIIRALGFDTPPDVALLHDPYGFGLILGLVIKEVPFLLIIAAAALPRLPMPLADAVKTGRMLGRSDGTTWIFGILPMLFPLIRLPVLIVLAYSLTVVDMALILGPSNPPTLAVLTLRVAQSPDIAALAPAARLALVQGLLVIGAIGFLLAAARLIRTILNRAVLAGRMTGLVSRSIIPMGRLLIMVLLGLGVLSAAALILWSFAARWSFPDLLPTAFSARAWRAGSDIGPALITTLSLGVVSALVSIVLVSALLEWRDRTRGPSGETLAAISALPLILPQAAFLFGLQVLMLRAGLRPGFGAVLFTHLAIVLPYTMLCFAGPWSALDPRLLKQAASLGASPSRVFYKVKLPLLTTPILSVLAIAFSVSVAQYLTTLMAGAGRVSTLTTEAVALSSGSDRRIAAAFGLMQAALPLAGFALALSAPRLIWRHRKGMLA